MRGRSPSSAGAGCRGRGAVRDRHGHRPRRSHLLDLVRNLSRTARLRWLAGAPRQAARERHCGTGWWILASQLLNASWILSVQAGLPGASDGLPIPWASSRPWSGSVFQQRVWPASKVSSSMRSGRTSRSACEIRTGTESSRAPWRIRVGVARYTAHAVQSRVSHGIASFPAAAGSPLQAQLVVMTSAQLRTGEARMSAAISSSCRGGRRVGGQWRHPLTGRKARRVALDVERRTRWPRLHRSSLCGRGLFGRVRLVAILRCCGN